MMFFTFSYIYPWHFKKLSTWKSLKALCTHMKQYSQLRVNAHVIEKGGEGRMKTTIIIVEHEDWYLSLNRSKTPNKSSEFELRYTSNQPISFYFKTLNRCYESKPLKLVFESTILWTYMNNIKSQDIWRFSKPHNILHLSYEVVWAYIFVSM